MLTTSHVSTVILPSAPDPEPPLVELARALCGLSQGHLMFWAVVAGLVMIWAAVWIYDAGWKACFQALQPMTHRTGRKTATREGMVRTEGRL